jgi:citrate synthase
MMFKMTEVKYKPNPVIEKALDVLFILHADHEQNCSASAMRGRWLVAGRSVQRGGGGLRGAVRPAPRRRQRSRAAHASGDRQQEQDPRVPREGARRRRDKLMGFGHRVYKNYDPRAKVIKKLAYEVFDEVGKNPLIDIAVELERIALEDDFFVKRKLYPNVDFYSGLIYQAMGFPVDLFPVLFALGRMPGWLAQWEEMLIDKEQKIARPRQVYLGSNKRSYVPLSARE